MKPFDLEKALAGEPVNVIGDTVPKRIIAKSAYHDNRYIVEDKHGAYTLSLADLQEGFEMWQEPQPRVQLDLPAPLKHAEANQIVFKKGSRRIIAFPFLPNIAKHQDFLEAGSLFATKEDAQEWLDAMKGARK